MTRYATEIMERRRAAAAAALPPDGLAFATEVVFERPIRAGEPLRVEGRLADGEVAWSVRDSEGRCVCRGRAGLDPARERPGLEPAREDSFVAIPL